MTSTGPGWFDDAADADSQAWRVCVEHLGSYFAVRDGVPEYSGSRFDSYGDNPENRIIADDIVAVSMLSVRVPGHAALRFLEREVGTISSLLAKVPTDLNLADADPQHIAEGSPAYELWDVLRSSRTRDDGYGTGQVTTSKLLARKRPRLLPVYDRVVGQAFGLHNPAQHWDCVHGWLRGRPARERTLRELREAANVPPTISDLRVLDIVLWMHGRTDADEQEQRRPESP